MWYTRPPYYWWVCCGSAAHYICIVCTIEYICCNCVANCCRVLYITFSTWSTGSEIIFGLSVGAWSCCRTSCVPATASRTMFAWCIPASSTVRSNVLHNSRCAVWKELFKSNPRLLNCCHVISLANCQSKLDRLVNKHIHDIQVLELGIRRSGDVGNPENLFDGGKHSRGWVSRMECHLIENVLALKKFLGHQLNVILLNVSEHILYGVVDEVFFAISDTPEIRFLDHTKNYFTRACLNPITSQNRRNYSLCAICKLEFVWAVVPSGMMIGPRWVE